MIRPVPRSFLPALAALALAAPAGAQHWLEAAQRLVEDSTGVFVGHGPLDGAAGDELVLFEGTLGTYEGFSVFWNDGAGGFDRGPSTAFPIGSRMLPLADAVADVTGDGAPDLVVHDFTFGAYSLGVYPGQAGSEFGPLAPLAALEGQVEAAAFLNADADAAVELAVLNRDGSDPSSNRILRIWSWTGAGLAPGPALVLPSFTGGDPEIHSLAALDLTGDGRDDLAAGSRTSSEVRLFRVGDGAPVEAGALPFVPPSGPVNQVEVVAGDADGDGDGDVVAFARTSWAGDFHAIGAFLVEGASIAALPVQPVLGFGAGDFRMADWDGDGDDDWLGHTFDGEMQTLEMLGGGVVSTSVTRGLTHDQGLVGTADLDGDGELDAVLDHGVVWGTGEVAPFPHRIAGDAFGPAEVDRRGLFDWEGDGDVDFFGRDGRIQVNDGTGRFDDPDAIVYAQHTSQVTAAGDFDGDGRVDLLLPFYVLGTPNMMLIADDGLGGFAPRPAAKPGDQIHLPYPLDHLIPVADLDLDGDLDGLALLGAVWENDGTGYFAFDSFLNGGNPREAADADLDGDADVLFTSGDGLVLERNSGDGSFSPEVIHPDPNDGQYPAFVDLEGDGDLDILSDTTLAGVVNVFENDGVGYAHSELEGLRDSAAHLTVADVDGDGLGDVVAASSKQEHVGGDRPWIHVWRRNDPDSASYDAARIYAGNDCRGFADVDADGDIDVVGPYLVRNLARSAPAAGAIRQYGDGFAGTAGVVPVLGASGPLVGGNTDAVLRVRRALGGALAVLALDLSEAAVPGVPFPGMSLYVGGAPGLLVLPLAGPADVAAEGTLDIPLGPYAAVAGGISVYHQLFVPDGGSATGWSATNGLELLYSSL